MKTRRMKRASVADVTVTLLAALSLGGPLLLMAADENPEPGTIITLAGTG